MIVCVELQAAKTRKVKTQRTREVFQDVGFRAPAMNSWVNRTRLLRITAVAKALFLDDARLFLNQGRTAHDQKTKYFTL